MLTERDPLLPIKVEPLSARSEVVCGAARNVRGGRCNLKITERLLRAERVTINGDYAASVAEAVE